MDFTSSDKYMLYCFIQGNNNNIGASESVKIIQISTITLFYFTAGFVLKIQEIKYGY